ncbi:MAG: hypothetical protein KC731_29540, partial [Myxococcales bacterium]|nr:hypothetical protein [Myxococcales bacterium]
MSPDLPHLSRGDVEQSLRELYRKQRKRHLFAFHGTGQEDLVEIPEHGRVRVVPVRSELDLRANMPDLGVDDERIAFLVPWRGEIPMDLAGRFALGGRVQRIGREARVRRLFGVAAADANALASPLAEYLLRPEAQASYELKGNRLTEDAMWETWLHHDWKVPVEGGLALDTLLGWAATDGRGGSFGKAMTEAVASGVRDALLTYLEARHGRVARLIVEAWEQGTGGEVLQWALIFEPLSRSEDAAVKMWMKQSVLAQFQIQDEAERLALAAALGEVGGRALRYVAQRVEDQATVRNLIRDADARVNDSTVRAALVDDGRLPSSWSLQLAALGRLLAAGAEDPTVPRVREARDRLHKLESHDMARDTAQTAALRRASKACQLMAWLATDPMTYDVPGQQPFAEAEHLAAWYAEEGGFVDWARRGARGTASDDFGRGVQAVVEKADAHRDELDRRFTRGLKAWIESGRPSGQVVPIDQAVKRVAVPFLQERASRRLLVLLLDGMAWAQ